MRGSAIGSSIVARTPTAFNFKAQGHAALSGDVLHPGDVLHAG